ncbi:hypothetical protein DPV78_000539 [Talaromyces pinophilus]|nr:hypothetical protein DPV78_000539 [Talaromyces pinophilus]
MQNREKTLVLDTTPQDVSDGSIEDHLYVDPVTEKKLLRKLDLWISPVVCVVFLAAYLDRSNIGNAASAGMTADLGMNNSQYGNAVTLFYATYVFFEIPSVLFVKKFHPRRMIPALMFCWSLVIIGSGFMHNAGELYATRLLLGVFEAGMYPCLSLYLTTYYKPTEQALRVSYMFVSAALSGAFGGLFAYALLKMVGVAGYAGWRWLYIIEGCASVVVSILVYIFLPDSFETARFLTEDEKQLMRTRAALMTRYNGKSVMEWSEIKKAVLDLKTWISCWSQFMGDICSFGFSTFLPLIIKSFGFDTVTTQLLLIPVYSWAAGIYIGISWFSDKYRRRAPFMIPAALVTAVGYAINLGSNSRGPLYFATFLIGPGIYIIAGINSTWVLNCHAGYYKRATAIGMNQSLGNCAGLVVGQVFKSKVNGKYQMGLSFSLGAICLAGLGHFVLALYLNQQNKKRDTMSEEKRAQAIEQGKNGDFHPDFRYPI